MRIESELPASVTVRPRYVRRAFMRNTVRTARGERKSTSPDFFRDDLDPDFYRAPDGSATGRIGIATGQEHVELMGIE